MCLLAFSDLGLHCAQAPLGLLAVWIKDIDVGERVQRGRVN
ncbi:hypothetical protein ACFSC4_22910 [Deinococcus malanensis]